MKSRVREGQEITNVRNIREKKSMPTPYIRSWSSETPYQKQAAKNEAIISIEKVVPQNTDACSYITSFVIVWKWLSISKEFTSNKW